MSGVANVIQPDPSRLKKVKSILVTQVFPTEAAKVPYSEIERKYNVKVDFRSFIDVKGISFKDFRKQKINILEHTAIIFTSRNAIDHFFRICKEAKIEVPADMK
ncbi:MAG: Uroporphyrinogen-III synthase, partial [Bacteroidota bacterium]